MKRDRYVMFRDSYRPLVLKTIRTRKESQRHVDFRIRNRVHWLESWPAEGCEHSRLTLFSDQAYLMPLAVERSDHGAVFSMSVPCLKPPSPGVLDFVQDNEVCPGTRTIAATEIR
jgi:hypothetical protein